MYDTTTNVQWETTVEVERNGAGGQVEELAAALVGVRRLIAIPDAPGRSVATCLTILPASSSSSPARVVGC